MTTQAQRIRDALEAIGLKHGSWRTDGDFTLRTQTWRRRDAIGVSYSEFGDAIAHTQNRQANAVIEQHALELAEQEISVSLVYLDDQLVTAIVSSRYNPRRAVAVNRDGKWSNRERA